MIDRLLAPVEPQIGYNGGDTFPQEFEAILDPFVLLGVAAAATDRMLIGGNVLNAAWYPPALLARSLTTIDVISGGRLVPGFGIGWSPEEFEAVGIPMAKRGSRLEETLDALEQLWTADPAEFHGEHWQVPTTRAALKPVRRPPIYLAGFTSASMRRVAQRADGWLPVLAPPKPADIAAGVNHPLAAIREMAAEAGRDPKAVDAILRLYPSERSEKIVKEMADLIKQVEDQTDIQHLFVDLMFQVDDVDDMLRSVEGILSAVR